MRYAAVAVLGLAIVVAAVLYVVVSRPGSTAVATPTIRPSPSASAPTPSPSPPASVSGALGAVTIQVTRTAVPAEFRYLVLGSGEEFRLVVLDLNAGRLAQVATARIALLSGAPGELFAAFSTSGDGRTVLVTFVLPDATDSVFVVRPESGDARLLLRGELRGAVISSDGVRLAVGRNDQDRSLTGLWVGTVADGAMKRLLADDSQFNGSPPLP